MVGLGSDGYSPRLWDEFKTAVHLQKLRARDPRVGFAEAYAAAFLNNREIVRKVWGMEIGRIESGARADLVLVDYFPPTPFRSDTLVRPSALRRCQRARRFADGERAFRDPESALCHDR